MASLVAEELFDCVLSSRILGTGALRGGMPRYKYYSNRALTLMRNLLLGHKLSEYHTGYRAFSRRLLEALPLALNSNGFEFDNEVLAEIIYAGSSIGEITCPARYDADSSSIGFWNSEHYGLQVLRISVTYCLSKRGWVISKEFDQVGSRS